MTFSAEETKKTSDGVFRLSNLAVGRNELEEALTDLEDQHIPHRVDKHEAVDTTDWPKQPDGEHTVYAIYAKEAQTRGQQSIAGGQHG